jgi:hypothetical protein
MIEEIAHIIEVGLKKVRQISIPSMSSNIGDILQAAMEKEVSKIQNIADMISDAVTFIVLAIALPGSSAGLEAGEAAGAGGVVAAKNVAKQGARAEKAARKAGKVAGQVAKEAGKKNIMKLLGKAAASVGKLIKDMNPVEKIKDIAMPFILNPILRNKISPKLILVTESVFEEFELALNDEIENEYLSPMREKERLMVDVRKMKESAIIKTDKDKISVEEDLRLLTKLTTG